MMALQAKEEDDIEQLRREVNQIKTDVRSLYQNQQVVQRELVQVKHDHQFLSARLEHKVADLSKYVDSQIQSVRQRQHCVPTEFYLIVIIIIILFFLLG
jgi:predicted  nucleic acid-binding Zn-ribbon protein